MKEGDDAMMFVRPEAFAIAYRSGNASGDHFAHRATSTNEEFEGNVLYTCLHRKARAEKRSKYRSLRTTGNHFARSATGQNITLEYDDRTTPSSFLRVNWPTE